MCVKRPKIRQFAWNFSKLLYDINILHFFFNWEFFLSILR